MAFVLFRYLLFTAFFFNESAPTQIYTLSLHDALPISPGLVGSNEAEAILDAEWATAAAPNAAIEMATCADTATTFGGLIDRKSTRLNSSHLGISYAVFCLKKKNQQHKLTRDQQQQDKY